MKQKEILAYIDDMQIEAGEAAIELLDEEYNSGMIAAYNNVRSLMTNPEFAKNYTWFTGEGE